MERDKRQGYENCILAFAVMAVSAFLMSFFFDFYFDMNDDTMMRDIMSGVYSGTPDGHNMQTLYPLGALIALCYRISGSFPWYGSFLFLCQFGCFFWWVSGCVRLPMCYTRGYRRGRMMTERGIRQGTAQACGGVLPGSCSACWCWCFFSGAYG